MAECILLKSNGGDGSDDCTATKAQVLTGHTAITQDSDDEPVLGTMPNRGAWTGSVAMNGSVAIPQGHHNGAGKVNGPSITDRGAWGTNIGVNGRVTIPKGYHNGAGSVGQSIPVQGAETDGDRTWAINMSAGEGQMNFGVRNYHYLNGVNWIRGNIPNYYSHNIKKGVNMGGLVGTWEGYVANPTDLYYKGSTPVTWGIDVDPYGRFTFNETYILVEMLGTANNKQMLYPNEVYNFAGYSYLHIEFMSLVTRRDGLRVQLNDVKDRLKCIFEMHIPNVVANGTYTASIPLSTIQKRMTPYLIFSNHLTGIPAMKFQVTRIRLA